MGAGDGVARVRLPSGGWWDIRTRPLWKHVSEWRGAVRAGEDERALLERALVSLTTGWSFSEEVGTESVGGRDADDLAAVLEVFCREVEPFESAGRSVEFAERLFAALTDGRAPADFAEAHLMLATGWSWRELQETPADVVERTWTYVAVREVMRGGGIIHEGHEGREGERDIGGGIIHEGHEGREGGTVDATG